MKKIITFCIFLLSSTTAFAGQICYPEGCISDAYTIYNDGRSFGDIYNQVAQITKDLINQSGFQTISSGESGRYNFMYLGMLHDAVFENGKMVTAYQSSFGSFITFTHTTCSNGASNYPYCDNICSNGYNNYPICGPETCGNGGSDYPTCTPPCGACTLTNACGQTFTGSNCSGSCQLAPESANINDSCIQDFKCGRSSNVSPNGSVTCSYKLPTNVRSLCSFVDLTTTIPKPVPGLQNLDQTTEQAKISNIQKTTRFCLLCKFYEISDSSLLGEAAVHQWVKVIRLGED